MRLYPSWGIDGLQDSVQVEAIDSLRDHVQVEALIVYNIVSELRHW